MCGVRRSSDSDLVLSLAAVGKDSMSWCEATGDGILVRVKVQPRAKRSQVVGLHGEPPRLKIRLAAPPVDGKANEELLQFFKKALNIPLAQLKITRGQASQFKDVLCAGVSLEKVMNLLNIM